MSEVMRDRVLGTVLLLVAIAWIAAVQATVPEGFGGSPVGPRDFPLALGFLLAVLATLMIGSSFLGAHAAGRAGAGRAKEVTARRAEIWSVAVTLGFLVGYVALMYWFGFVVGTTAATAAFLWFGLGKRSPALMILMPVGISLGIWLIMGKLMSVYLPKGSLIQVF